jgi:hypothetical protein
MDLPLSIRLFTSLSASKLRMVVMPCFLNSLACRSMISSRLGVETDDVDAAGEGLEVGIGTGDFAEAVHHVEGVFVAVEVERLEAGAAAGFEVRDAGIDAGLDGRHEILGEDAGAVAGLKTVAKGGAHDFYLFFGHNDISSGVDFKGVFCWLN